MTHFAKKGVMNAKSAKEQRMLCKWQKRNVMKVQNAPISMNNTKIKK